ncbi:hypothetical protein AX17_000551 [Amanita inopinata Kibby_2008]|nr:hypothetical protein AX17_000551 [Amanita inopinata Kibby_2008]
MQSYPNYGYYQQSAYPQTPLPALRTPTVNGYPQFYQQSSAHPAYAPPPAQVTYPAAYPHASATNHAMDRPRSHRRINTAPTAPLKSAMKQLSNAAPDDDFPNLTRSRTNSNGHNMLARTRTQSNPKPPELASDKDPNFVPVHMFISFRNSNEIRFENIPGPAVNELHPRLEELWPPGLDQHQRLDKLWVVKFRDAPWEMKSHVAEARNIILDLFTLFARRGYIFRTAINIRDQYPRLVFEATATDPDSQFFLGYFNKGGRQFNLINPPSHIDVTLGAHLKQVLPHRIARDEVENDAIRVIELKRKRYFEPVVEPSVFMMHIFKILSDMGFFLHASVALARNGLLPFKSHHELLIFKGRIPPDML